MDLRYILASREGRIARMDWWAGVLALALVIVAAVVAIRWALGQTPAGFLLVLALQLLLIYPTYALSAKRFQDRGKPGSLALIGIGIGLVSTVLQLFGLSNPEAPTLLDGIVGLASAIVGIWYLIELGCLRGTVGPNAYGPDPLERR